MEDDRIDQSTPKSNKRQRKSTEVILSEQTYNVSGNRLLRLDKVRQYLAIGIKRAEIIQLIKDEGFEVADSAIDRDIALARKMPSTIPEEQRDAIIKKELARLEHISIKYFNSKKPAEIEIAFKAMELTNNLIGLGAKDNQNNININTGTIVQLPIDQPSPIEYETIDAEQDPQT